MKAQLKRRWPIKKALICSSGDLKKILAVNDDGISSILKNQLNVEDYTLIEIPADDDKTGLRKILNLLKKKMPIVPNVTLVRKNIAPRVKRDMDRVIKAFEKADKFELMKSLYSSDKYLLSYEGGREIDLSLADLELSYTVSEGYAMSERDNLMVFIATERDKDLTAKGLLRDLARNLQQLRKEHGYDPTDILSAAFIANLEDDEIPILSLMKDELMYLVRTRSVVLSKEPKEKIDYKMIDLDGRKIKIHVE
jgi:isoleucyl-tRNA synthetase